MARKERVTRKPTIMGWFTGILIMLAVFVAISGCVDIDKRYIAEKMLWKAQSAADRIAQQANGQKLSEGDYDAMIALFRKVIDKFPLEKSASEAQFTIANLYVAQGKFDQARAELKGVIENFTIQPAIAARAQTQIAKTYEKQGNTQEAMATYDKIIDLYPLTKIGLETPLYLIDYYQNKKDEEGVGKALRKAIRHYTKLINNYAKTSAGGFYYNYLARAYLKAKEWNNALATWQKIITDYPNTSVAMRALLGQAELCVQHLKDYNKAIGYFEVFIRQYPKFDLIKQVKLRLAGLYLANDQTHEARQIFAALLKDNPTDKEIGIRCHFGLAACARKDKNSDEMEKEYQNVRDKYPDDPRSLGTPLLVYRYYLGLKEKQKGKQVLEAAIKEYEHLMQVYAKQAQRRITVARALYYMYVEDKEYNKALALLQAFDRQYPNDPGFLLSMASLYLNEMKQLPQAKQVYEAIVKRFPKNAELVTAVSKKIATIEKMLIQKQANR